MKLLWEERAWDEYCYWQSQDKKTLKKINELIKDIQRNSYEALESPNLLKEIFKAGGADESTTAIVLFIRNTMEQ